MPFDSSLIHLQRPMQQGRPRLNYDVVQRLNVRALWSFYEGGGGVLHDDVGGQDAPVVEDGGSSIDWVPGKIGGPVWSVLNDGYAKFTGTNFFAPIGDGNPHQYTISSWALSTDSSSEAMIFNIGKVGDNRGIQLGLFGTNLLFNNVSLQTIVVALSGVDFELGRWHLLTATAEPDFASRLYLDGKLVGGPTGSAAGQNTIPDNGVISGNSNLAAFDNGWRGELAQIMYCDRGLLAEEVAELFNPATRWDIYRAPGPTIAAFLVQLPVGATSFEDTFVRGTDADLTAHTPTVTGTSWTEFFSDSTNIARVLAVDDFVAANGDDGSEKIVYSALPAPSSAEYNVEATVATIENHFGVVGRMVGAGGSNIDDAYGVRINAGGGLTLYKIVAGTRTLLDTGGTVSATDVIRLELTDATKKVFINDSEVMSSTDNALTAKGQAGIFWGDVFVSLDAISDASGFDTFKVFNVAGLGGERGIGRGIMRGVGRGI